MKYSFNLQISIYLSNSSKKIFYLKFSVLIYLISYNIPQNLKLTPSKILKIEFHPWHYICTNISRISILIKTSKIIYLTSRFISIWLARLKNTFFAPIFSSSIFVEAKKIIACEIMRVLSIIYPLHNSIGIFECVLSCK